MKRLILYWAINESKRYMETECRRMLDTSKIYDIEIQPIGIGIKFESHTQRLQILQKFLTRLSSPNDTIIICMDGADTLWNDSINALIDKFLKKKTRILISGEKDYTYQYSKYRDRYDQEESKYRYVNAGTFMGYADSLLGMINEMIEIKDTQYPDANDQGLMGAWVHRNIFNKGLVKLDTTCSIFWVCTGDWMQLHDDAYRSLNNIIYNNNTGTRPAIIHCVGIKAWVSEKGYTAAYNHIMKCNTLSSDNETKVLDTKVLDTKVLDTKVLDTKVLDTKVLDAKTSGPEPRIIDIKDMVTYVIHDDDSDKKRNITQSIEKHGINAIWYKFQIGKDIRMCETLTMLRMFKHKKEVPFLIIRDGYNFNDNFTGLIQIPKDCDALILKSDDRSVITHHSADYHRIMGSDFQDGLLVVSERFRDGIYNKALQYFLDIHKMKTFKQALSDEIKHFNVLAPKKPWIDKQNIRNRAELIYCDENRFDNFINLGKEYYAEYQVLDHWKQMIQSGKVNGNKILLESMSRNRLPDHVMIEGKRINIRVQFLDKPYVINRIGNQYRIFVLLSPQTNNDIKKLNKLKQMLYDCMIHEYELIKPVNGSDPGLYLESHKITFKKMMDHNIKSALIMEDRICLKMNKADIDESYHRLPKDWSMASLFCEHNDMVSINNSVSSNDVMTAGYFITNGMARKITKHNETLNDMKQMIDRSMIDRSMIDRSMIDRSMIDRPMISEVKVSIGGMI